MKAALVAVALCLFPKSALAPVIPTIVAEALSERNAFRDVNKVLKSENEWLYGLVDKLQKEIDDLKAQGEPSN